LLFSFLSYNPRIIIIIIIGNCTETWREFNFEFVKVLTKPKKPSSSPPLKSHHQCFFFPNSSSRCTGWLTYWPIDYDESDQVFQKLLFCVTLAWHDDEENDWIIYFGFLTPYRHKYNIRHNGFKKKEQSIIYNTPSSLIMARILGINEQ
jgi:hypothetical protein